MTVAVMKTKTPTAMSGIALDNLAHSANVKDTSVFKRCIIKPDVFEN